MKSRQYVSRMRLPEILCVLIICFGLSHAVVNVSVTLCAINEAKWTVTGGELGGRTYIETTTNTSCLFNITNTATENFEINFLSCGATPVSLLAGTVQEFIIVVQGDSFFNAATDTRSSVRCEFNEGTTAIQIDFVGQSNNPSGNPDKNITAIIDPKPVLALYTIEGGNETLVGPSTVLALGTNVTARITIDKNTTDYNLQIIFGEISSKIVGESAILSSLVLLNGTTFCALHSVFLSFEYKFTSEGVRYAETQLQVFLPTATSANLQTTNLQLTLLFRVALCLKSGGCVQESCPDRSVTRRRRQTATTGDQNDGATYDLEDGYQIQLAPNADSLSDQDGSDVVRGTNVSENTVCLSRTQFWGLIMGLIGFLALACLASCCLCFFFLRCRRRNRDQRESKKMSETSSVSTMSTLSMDRKLTGEPVNKQAFVLPRFFPVLNKGGSN